MAKKKKLSQVAGSEDKNQCIFHSDVELFSRLGLVEESDWRKDGKYPSFWGPRMFAKNEKTEYGPEDGQRLGEAFQEDIEKSPYHFGKVDVVLRMAHYETHWGISINIVIPDSGKDAEISEALHNEKLSRTMAVMKELCDRDRKNDPK